jgi:hypothetical protein
MDQSPLGKLIVFHKVIYEYICVFHETLRSVKPKFLTHMILHFSQLNICLVMLATDPANHRYCWDSGLNICREGKDKKSLQNFRRKTYWEMENSKLRRR